MKSESRENIWSLSRIPKPSSSFQQHYDCWRHFSEQKTKLTSHSCSFSSDILHRCCKYQTCCPAPQHIKVIVKGMGFLHRVDYRKKFRSCVFFSLVVSFTSFFVSCHSMHSVLRISFKDIWKEWNSLHILREILALIHHRSFIFS